MRCFAARRAILFAALAVVGLLAFPAISAGQASKSGKKPAPMFKDETKEKEAKRFLNDRIVDLGADRADGKLGTPEELKRMQDYFGKQLERWTYDINLALIPDLRGRLWMDFRDAYEKTPKDAHAAMNEFFLAELQKMAADENLDYVVRYNAVLQLGELNSVELTKTGQGSESPLPAALPVLLAMYEKADNHAAVRMAAFVGLLRHIKLGIEDDAARKQVQAAMFALLNQTKAAEEVDEDAHLYLRRRAAQALGWLGMPGTSDRGREVYDALLAIVKDEKQSMQFRADAVRAIGELRLQGVAGVDVGDLVKTLGILAIEAVESGGDDVLEKSELEVVESEKARPIQFCLKNVKLALRGPDVDNPTGGLAQIDAGEQTNKLLQDLAMKLEDLPKEQKEENKDLILIATKVDRIRELLGIEPPVEEGEGDPAAEGEEGKTADGEEGKAAEGDEGKAADAEGDADGDAEEPGE